MLQVSGVLYSWVLHVSGVLYSWVLQVSGVFLDLTSDSASTMHWLRRQKCRKNKWPNTVGPIYVIGPCKCLVRLLVVLKSRRPYNFLLMPATRLGFGNNVFSINNEVNKILELLYYVRSDIPFTVPRFFMSLHHLWNVLVCRGWKVHIHIVCTPTYNIIHLHWLLL